MLDRKASKNLTLLVILCISGIAGFLISPFMAAENNLDDNDPEALSAANDPVSIPNFEEIQAPAESLSEELNGYESEELHLNSHPRAPSSPQLLSSSAYTLTRGQITPYFVTSAGLYKYFRFYLPFDSARYYLRLYEYAGDAATMNVDMYIRWNAYPSLTSYDFKATTSNWFETYENTIPDDNEYGWMYILVRCTWGAGHYRLNGYYQDDGNGAWRNADSRPTPEYGVQNSLSGSLGFTDTYDFYKVYLYSGQVLYLNFAVTGGSNARVYIYSPTRQWLAWDLGSSLVTYYRVTSFYGGWYYFFFYNPDYDTYSYTGYYTNSNPDLNNRYEDATTLVDGVNNGSMSWTDYNDYGWFWADSGEEITIDIAITGTLSSYGYLFLLYTTSEPTGSNYFKWVYAGGVFGNSKTIEYYCGEYPTSEVEPGTRTKIYIRVWNRVRHYGGSDPSSTYTITISRNVYPKESNDRMSGAQDFTYWYNGAGTNSTNPSDYTSGHLGGENDVNDWFRIPATPGYTIDLAFNSSGTPAPYLDGYLVNSTGHVVKADTSYNITIKHTIPMTYGGSYYWFRLYERAAAYSYGSYTGTSDYDWYIYTSAYDFNDNFTTADELTPPETVYGIIADPYDTNDYYKVEVPSGYNVTGWLFGSISHLQNLKLYLYDASETEVDSDQYISVAPKVEAQNKNLDTQTYYLRVEKTATGSFEYTLKVQLEKLENDDDMAGATVQSIGIGENATGSDSMDTNDINDYYSFAALSGDLLLVNVTGADDLVVRLVMNSTNGEVVLVEETVSGGSAAFEYYPHAFYPASTYYLRICNPNGAASGAYSWNITRVEYDTEDGYMLYSSELESGESTSVSDSLSASDTNDWYLIWVRTGEELEIELTSTLSDPHAGFELITFLHSEIQDNGTTVSTVFNNTLPVKLPVYIEVVNEAGGNGTYTLDITVGAIDSDSNGLPGNAPTLPLDTNTANELAFDDIVDLYAVEIRSGYNLTISFELDSLENFTGRDLGCLILDENLLPLEWIYANESGVVTYSNPNLNPVNGYVQFYNIAPWLGLNSTESYGKFTWNATLINDDPDGDFHKATALSGPTAIENNELFANITYPSYNLSDINDFYKVSLAQGGVLSISVTTSGVSDPWFGIYVYNASEIMVANATGSDELTLLFNAGDNGGDYYIRIYDIALAEGSYTMAVSISIDSDSYFGGATAVTPGNQTADSLGTSDIVDISSISLEVGWRLKVNATVTGTAPDVDLLIYDPDRDAYAGNFTGTDFLDVEVSANSSGTYYIQFYNTGATSADYSWWVYVYEDENGHTSTALGVGEGDYDDSVQELDKLDYFALTGESGEAFTVTCSLPATLHLELYLYNSSGGLIDFDATAPGLAITHTPASTDTFYILFINPQGETGDYSFTVTGVGEPPVPGPGVSESEEENPLTLLNEEIGDFEVWQYLVGGAGFLVVLLLLKKLLFRGGKK